MSVNDTSVLSTKSQRVTARTERTRQLDSCCSDKLTFMLSDIIVVSNKNMYAI